MNMNARKRDGRNAPLQNRPLNKRENKFVECILDPGFTEIIIFKTYNWFIKSV